MKRKNQAGFTIIELMLTIAIGAILVALAIPSYTNMVLNNCLTSKTNAFVSAMQLARSTAVTIREDVTVGSLDCRLDANDDGAADGVCDAANEFGVGLVVFRDIDADGLADDLVEDIDGDGVLDVGEDLNANNLLDVEIVKQIRFNCAATMDETVDGANDVINNSTALVYSPNGSATPLGTINVCDTRTAGTYNGRQITLSTTGRPTTDPAFTLCP
ncbi:MAG TPA: GspH/FimT family pseudopilin [Gammaproteobacteria bacterium]|nr:GspH/FimT family pseudopilin [Gammaproteobacteria bacterium]